VGVKTEGGVLDQVLREVEVECLPSDIPGHIDVDVSELGMHQVIRVSGLPHSDKIKYLTSEDATVAHVVSIREEVAPVAEAVEGAAAAAVAGEGAAPTEPEVAKKGKTDTEGAAAAPPAPDAKAAKK
jgi:large subunit ribosomal protein L25